MILWGVDSGDWGKLDAAKIEKRTLDGAYAGSIISLRDGNPETVKALPGIIKGLKDKGYHIVTVDTLLAGDIRPGSVAYGLNDVQQARPTPWGGALRRRGRPPVIRRGRLL